MEGKEIRGSWITWLECRFSFSPLFAPQYLLVSPEAEEEEDGEPVDTADAVALAVASNSVPLEVETERIRTALRLIRAKLDQPEPVLNGQ